jgi:hypothetical protein
MLAYLLWHRAAQGVEIAAYEHALERFHRSLARRPPSGLRGSAALRAPVLPWLEPAAAPGYEDWYLIDGWSSLGVLEEAAIGPGHATSHRHVAQLSAPALGAVYRLSEGEARLDRARVAVWVQSAPASVPTIADLLGDGMDGGAAGLWRRCLNLGPAPEYCVLAPAPPAGVAPARLPEGWRASACPRELLWAS